MFIGREEVLKKEIFERYLKTDRLIDEYWEFCEKTDWHPVDELPLNPSSPVSHPNSLFSMHK